MNYHKVDQWDLKVNQVWIHSENVKLAPINIVLKAREGLTNWSMEI